MTITSNDALILQSIFHSEGADGADTKSIIAYADYVNHAIITPEEWTHALTVLSRLGLLTQHKDKLQTSTEFKIWWKKKYKAKVRINALTELDEIYRYLVKTYEDDGFNDTQCIALHLDDFQNAVANYCKH